MDFFTAATKSAAKITPLIFNMKTNQLNCKHPAKYYRYAKLSQHIIIISLNSNFYCAETDLETHLHDFWLVI